MLEVRNLYKTYRSVKGVTHRALEDVSITFPEVGLVMLLGKSGSGKSTLLNIIGGLDEKDSGDVLLNNQSIFKLSQQKMNLYRNAYLGFIFQEHNLIPSLTVFENVLLALELQGKKSEEKVVSTLKNLDILEIKDRQIFEISGGQRQRVAIARALVKEPKIILADEPTGSLDQQTSLEIMKILKEVAKKYLVITVTHDMEIATRFGDRLIELKDGVVLRDLELSSSAIDEEQIEVVANSIVKIPPSYQLKDDDLTTINQIVSKSNHDTYVTIEDDKNVVKAFFPHLRGAIDDKSLEQDGRFHQYQRKDDATYVKSLVFSKVNLPLKRAFSFGLMNLKAKVFYLVIMLLITMISISLFAVGENFAYYDQTSGMAYSLNQQGIKVASIISKMDVINNNEFEQIHETDILKVKSIVEDLHVYQTYDRKLIVKGYNPKQYLFNAFRGFVEVNDITTLGFKYAYIDQELNQLENAVGISLFAAKVLLNDRYVNSIANLINHKLIIEDQEYVISAIIDTLDDRFTTLLKNNYDNPTLLALHDNQAKQYLYHLFVKEGFTFNMFAKQDYVGSGLTTTIKINDYSQLISDIYAYDSVFAKNNLSYYVFDESKKDEGITIGINALLKVMQSSLVLPTKDSFFEENYFLEIKNYVETYNSSSTYIKAMKNNNFYYASNNRPIYAVVYDSTPGQVNTKLDSIGVSQSTFNSILLRDKTSTHLLVGFINQQHMIYPLAKKMKSEGYTLFTPYNQDYETLNKSLTAFNVYIRLVSLVLALVVVLLLYGFISSSIKSSRKEIGILQALGARFRDIVYIFLLETLTIGILSFTLSCLFTLIGAYAINTIYSKSVGYAFLIINFNYSLTLKMLLISLIVSFFASIIPIRHLGKLKIVEVIASKN